MKVCYLQYFHGLEEAVYRNIKACVELSQTTQTAFGPRGMLPAVDFQAMVFFHNNFQQAYQNCISRFSVLRSLFF